MPSGLRLKADANSNMALMSVTCDVSQRPMSWLKADAPLNRYDMSVTRDVSHRPMSRLKADAPLNRYDMSVTRDVSQQPMGPFVGSTAAPFLSARSTRRTACLIVKLLSCNLHHLRKCVRHGVPSAASLGVKPSAVLTVNVTHQRSARSQSQTWHAHFQNSSPRSFRHHAAKALFTRQMSLIFVQSASASTAQLKISGSSSGGRS